MTKALPYTRSFLWACLLLLASTGSAQTWEDLGSTPFYKHHSNGFSHDGIGYVFEGVITDDVSRSMWSYDPATDEWNSLIDFPGPARAVAIGDPLDGKYYYGFGRTNQAYLNDLWVFDPVDTSFTELATCPCEGRTHPALVAYEGKVYIGNGSGQFSDLSDWWVYDIATDTWAQKTGMPGGRRHHPFFFTEGDYVYVGGGHVNTWYKWHITDETWTQISGTPLGRVAGSQFEYNGKGYLLGGDDRVHDHVPADERFMRYDPATDTWEKLPQTPYGKWANSSFVIDDYVYFFGGLSSDIRNDDVLRRFDLTSLDPISSTQELEVGGLEVFPNPTASGSFTVEFTTTDFSDWSIKFVDLTGRNMTDAFVSAGSGAYSTTVKGSFIFYATHEDGRSARRLVVVE